MKVKLLKNVTEDNGSLKVSKRRNKNYVPLHKNAEGEIVEAQGEEFIFIPFLVGAVIEMSEESGNKYIEKGLAVKDE